jgi:tetraacyldisaccharide 4'-kinase
VISDDLWYGESVPARLARGALAPASLLYRGVIACRNRLYDTGRITSHPAPIPVISVGNLTVGGTGKTPFSAFLVKRLVPRGMTPAIVMRGYGDDEWLVHGRLNPGVLLYASPDRVAGIERAALAGADVVVLDDAFQHRRARRDLDIVLVSGDRWRPDL